MSDFNKETLTTGNRVVYENGEVGIVLKDIDTIAFDDSWDYIHDCDNGYFYKEGWEIIEVWEGYTQNGKVLNFNEKGVLLWKKPVEKTPEQIEIEKIAEEMKKLQVRLDELL